MATLADYVDRLVDTFNNYLSEPITGEKIYEALGRLVEAVQADPAIEAEIKEILCDSCMESSSLISENVYGNKANFLEVFKQNLQENLEAISDEHNVNSMGM